MRITPLEIHEQTFRIAFRGFDPVEVDGFLQRIADELERLTEERDALRAELEEERRTRTAMEAALHGAQALQEGLVAKAREEGEILRSQARLRADRILAEANEELLRLRRDLHALQERRSLWLADLGALAQSVGSWVAEKQDEPVTAPGLIADPPAEEPAPAAGAEDALAATPGEDDGG